MEKEGLTLKTRSVSWILGVLPNFQGGSQMTQQQDGVLVGSKLDQRAEVGDSLIRRADGCVCSLEGIPKQNSSGHPTITITEHGTGKIMSPCCAAAFDLNLD